MPNADALVIPHDLRIAAGLLTRFPVRFNAEVATARGARGVWAYPLIGACLGLIASALLWSASAIGLPTAFSAAIALICLVVMTGALHEDGLADSADGLWGAWSTAERLRIMKDSHIGSYGVLALAGALMLKWSALTALVDTGHALGALLTAAAVSRATMVGLWATTRSARPGGIADRVGRPPLQSALLCAAIAGVIAAFCVGLVTTIVLTIMCLVTLAVIRAIAMAKIGGSTGDTLGATQQVSEIVAYGTLLAVLN